VDDPKESLPMSSRFTCPILCLGLVLVAMFGCARSDVPPAARAPAQLHEDTTAAAADNAAAMEPAVEPQNAELLESPARDDKPAPAAPAMAKASSWKTFKGAWFDVEYPSDFKVVPGQRSSTTDGVDAASFVSPDGRVEFHVFSPQWTGSPQWILLKSGEKVVERSEEMKDGKRVEWVTIAGPGGTYKRSYAETTNEIENTRRVFGIKYANQAAYDSYRDLYLKFKESLKQYAD
jgi:hypothetical protein